MGQKHGRNNYTRVLTRNGGYSSTETERLGNSKGKRKQPMSILSRVGKSMVQTEMGRHSGEVERTIEKVTAMTGRDAEEAEITRSGPGLCENQVREEL